MQSCSPGFDCLHLVKSDEVSKLKPKYFTGYTMKCNNIPKCLSFHISKWNTKRRCCVTCAGVSRETNWDLQWALVILNTDETQLKLALRFKKQKLAKTMIQGVGETRKLTFWEAKSK